MTQWVSASGDLASAATALGGLLLVFIGSVSTGYGAYDATQQAAVRRGFLLRGLLAFLGFLLSLSAAVLALAGKVTERECLVIASSACLGLALLSVLAAAVVSIIDLTA